MHEIFEYSTEIIVQNKCTKRCPLNLNQLYQIPGKLPRKNRMIFAIQHPKMEIFDSENLVSGEEVENLPSSASMNRIFQDLLRKDSSFFVCSLLLS